MNEVMRIYIDDVDKVVMRDTTSYYISRIHERKGSSSISPSSRYVARIIRHRHLNDRNEERKWCES